MRLHWVETNDDDECVIDTSAGITADIAEAYTTGQCYALAAALSVRTGWPIVATCQWLPGLPDALGPADERGILDPYALTIPATLGDVGVRDLLANALMHAWVMRPDGQAVDVHGPIDPVAFAPVDPGLGDRDRDPSCACAPGCLCRLPCCTAGSPRFFAYLDAGLIDALAAETPDQEPAIAYPNMDAAHEVADHVLRAIGWSPEPPVRSRATRPRVTRPQPERPGTPGPSLPR